jgi:hypothetical protein
MVGLVKQGGHMKKLFYNKEILIISMMILCSGCTSITHGGDRQYEGAVFPTMSVVPLPDDIEQLIKLLSDNNYELRIMATTKIGLMGPRGEMAVPALSINLLNENSELRVETIITLGKIGSESKSTNVLIIIILLSDNSVQARRVAAEALGQIGLKESVPALYKGLNDNDEIVAWKSAISIDNIMKLNIYTTTGLQVNEKGEIILIEKVRDWWNTIGFNLNWTNQ